MNPRLVNIVFVGLCYGLYSEGLDRLSTKLIVDNFQLPVFLGSTQLSFFVSLDVVGTILYIILMRFVEKRVDTSSPLAIGRAMLWATGLLIICILGFSTSPGLPMAVISLLAVGQMRGIVGPLQAAWINQRLDSSVRATIHSMFGQVDAIGQVFGGPVVGLVANLASVRAAVGMSSLLLSPALIFIRRANGIQTSEVEQHETITESII
jgi:DHA3 family tetracycline resistance protein-like MFS transporter